MVFEGRGNMSWDIWIIRTKTNTEEYKQINETNCIPISRDELLASWKVIEKTLNVSIEDEESEYPHLRGIGWSIEAYLNGEYETDKSLNLEIRGNECPTEAIGMMTDLLKARAFDTVTDRFLDVMQTSGFEVWKSFNKRVCDVINNN